ncbi:MAG: methyltransferase domain-containing protein [Planctomycetes bacterium]|nr:methyltransferase domain-containing protein [Planctomycetota bacterium]
MLQPVRDRAVEALWRAERDGRFLEQELAAIYPRGLKEAERAMLTELVYGVARWRGALDQVLERYRAGGRWKPRLRWILRVGVFQMAFLEHVPDRVAVDAAVRQAGAAFGSGGARLANAVLRRIQREWRIEAVASEAADPCRDLVVAPERAWRGPPGAFPDPAERPAENLAARLSWPVWLLERWIAAFGEDRTRWLATDQNRRPELHCWIDPARGDAQAVRAALAADGIVAEPTPHGLRIREGAARLFRSRPFRSGRLLVQDETAASVVPWLGVQRGDRVLELGAAPGTKTVQLARAVGDEGRVVAVDRSLRRLARVRENLSRFDLLDRADIVAADGAALGPAWAERFDRVLVDAPCSNTGVLARRQEARWRLRAADILALARIQRELLGAGLAALRRGGVLVYATCSIEAEENSAAVGSVPPGFRLAAEELVLPDAFRDGGYKARLVRE